MSEALKKKKKNHKQMSQPNVIEEIHKKSCSLHYHTVESKI